MIKSIAVVGAGVSGLTCGVTLVERGFRTVIFADEGTQRTTSAVAAAMWYPYDATPADKVIPWALQTYQALLRLAADANSGVSLIELCTFARSGEIQLPTWAIPLGARRLSDSEIWSRGREHGELSASRRKSDGAVAAPEHSAGFASGFSLQVPLMDTTTYLDHLADRFARAGGEIRDNVRLARLEEVPGDFNLVLNCAGIGARTLVNDPDLEPHRGQVVIVPRIPLSSAIVCDDPPLMYAIPRAKDCVLGGTNELSESRDVDPVTSSQILAECTRILDIDVPNVLAERVGIRPFRRSGVRLGTGRLADERAVIHNYGHGGSGFTLSWGCAQEVLSLAESAI